MTHARAALVTGREAAAASRCLSFADKSRATRPMRGAGRRFAEGALVLTVAAFSALALGGCSNAGTERGEPTPEESRSPTASASQSASPATRAIRKLTGDKTVELTTDTLPKPPPGFSAAEVAAFGDAAIDLVQRGISPALAAKTSAEAFDYVFANQYSKSTNATRDTFEAIGDYDYAWAVASQFAKPPTEPAQVLAARWQVSTSPGKTAAGTTAPRLLVVLSVAILHQVPVENPGPGEQQTAPIVIQRTYLIEGFEPLGGRSWWPAIGVQATPYFGGKCAPINGSLLTPATRPSTIHEDLNNLRKYLTRPKTIRGATSTSDDMADYVKKYCESP